VVVLETIITPAVVGLLTLIVVRTKMQVLVEVILPAALEDTCSASGSSDSSSGGSGSSSSSSISEWKSW